MDGWMERASNRVRFSLKRACVGARRAGRDPGKFRPQNQEELRLAVDACDRRAVPCQCPARAVRAACPRCQAVAVLAVGTASQQSHRQVDFPQASVAKRGHLILASQVTRATN